MARRDGRDPVAREPAAGVNRATIDVISAGVPLATWLGRLGAIGSRRRANAWVARGKVLLNGAVPSRTDMVRPLAPGDVVEIWADRPGSARTPAPSVVRNRSRLTLVHEDTAIVVAEKPAGLLVEPLPESTGADVTLVDLIRDHLRFDPRADVRVVHRIDRDTTGLVLFARHEDAWVALKRQFARHEPDRVYLAVAEGVVEPSAGTWRDTLVWDGSALRQRPARRGTAGGRPAVARYRVVERFPQATLLEVRLETGKRNQIRVQAALRGHPLIGEKIYRFRGAGSAPVVAFPRQALHAVRLAFDHPSHGARVEFVAPLPEDLLQLLGQLRRPQDPGVVRIPG